MIVGGGLSGLAVARHLQRTGLDWQLLESRQRFGGRILSRASKTGGVPVDLGPAWLWPHQMRVQALARDLGLSLEDQYSHGRLVFEGPDGEVRRDLDFSTMAGTRRVTGGLASVTDALVHELTAERLHLNRQITQVSRTSSGLKVRGQDNQGNVFEATARQVVMALPPRLAASRIGFSDLLSEEALQAMRAIPTWMAAHAKVVAIFEKPFWRDMGLSGDAISHRGPLMEIHDAGPADGSIGALFGFVHPTIVARMPEEADLLSAAGQQFTSLFGEQASSPDDIFGKIWLTDPDTAISSDASNHEHPPGGVPRAMRDAQANGLIFAGAEIAPDDPGLVEGALAAAEVVADALT